MNTHPMIARARLLPGILAPLLFIALPIDAAVLVKANFDTGYALGSIGGQSAGASDKGLTGAWTVNPGGNFAIVTESLSYAVSGGGTISGDGQALQYTYGSAANASDGAYISLQSSITSEIYIRFLIKVETPAPLSSTALFLWLSNNAASNHMGGHPGVGIYDSKLAAQSFFGSGEGADSRTAGQPVTAGTTYLIVAKLSKQHGATKYNAASLWINPAYRDRRTPVSSVTGTGINVTNITTIGFQFANMTDNGSNPKYLIDSIAIGTSWPDVVPAAR